MSPRKAPAKPAPESLDSLHEEWGVSEEPSPAKPAPEAAEAREDFRPLVTARRHEDDVAVIVAAWHADPTAQGFVHRGDMCGCRYLAGLALAATNPVKPDDEAGEEAGGSEHGA